MGTWQPDSTADVVVFSCGDRSFTVAEVMKAAHFRGELDPHWEKLLGSLRSCEKAEELGMEPDEATLQLTSEEFRLERDLITAEETEQWLARRGLTEDDFSDFLVRRFWEARFHEKAGAATSDFTAAEAALQDLLRADLLISGACDEMAMRLGERLAACDSPGGETCGPDLVADERRRFTECHKLEEAAIAPWLARLGGPPQWLDEMLRLEAIYRRHCQSLLTDEVVAREMTSHRMEFTRADLEIIELDSRDAAREALLCARDDGEPLQEVARRGRYPWRPSRPLLAELSDERRQQILCAAPGEVLDPLPHGDGFQVCRLIAKIEPHLNDPDIRHRIEKRILQRHFAELVAGHIRWLIEPKPTLSL